MATRRFTLEELNNWLSKSNHEMWTFRINDGFGDMGITGIISLEIRDKNSAEIADFVLSCRVMGRGIEEAMLSFVIEHARTKGIDLIRMRFMTTSKNKPFRDFLDRSKLDRLNNTDVYEWKVEKQYPWPPHLHKAVQ